MHACNVTDCKMIAQELVLFFLTIPCRSSWQHVEVIAHSERNGPQAGINIFFSARICIICFINSGRISCIHVTLIAYSEGTGPQVGIDSHMQAQFCLVVRFINYGSP